MRLRCHCDGNWLFLIHLFVDLYCVYLYWLCIIIHTQVPLSCYVVYDIAINMMDVLRRCCWAKIVCLCSFYVQSVRNTVSSQTRMKTNLRTVWTAFVSFGLPYRCYAFASIVTVYAITCLRLSQSALCSGARHHHLAIFNHIASALHESRTCLFFLKFSRPFTLPLFDCVF